MHGRQALVRAFSAIPGLDLRLDEPLAPHTRFGIGGPALFFVETASPEALMRGLEVARDAGLETVVIGGGTNLIVSDEGFSGLVLRYTAGRIQRAEDRIRVQAGAALQELVDFTIHSGLKGLETLAGIPGSVGGAVYGNAGAYGHSISERVLAVSFYDGSAIHELPGGECGFRYRESIFKRHKQWVILEAALQLEPANPEDLRKIADDILRVRNEKYPPSMRCAGSIFKNLLWADLPGPVRDRVPPRVVREGKVPAAYFLEQVGAKGMRAGDVCVAAYHANLIYNAGQGTAHDLCGLIAELKSRVRAEFGLELEEEVQYLGR